MIYLDGLESQSIAKQYEGIKQTEPWLDFYDKYGPTIGAKLQRYFQ